MPFFLSLPPEAEVTRRGMGHSQTYMPVAQAPGTLSAMALQDWKVAGWPL